MKSAGPKPKRTREEQILHNARIHQESVDRIRPLIPKFLTEGNQNHALSLRAWEFRSLVSLALGQWRLGEDPRRFMCEAIQSARQGSTQAQSMEPEWITAHWRDWTPAEVFSYLLGDNFERPSNADTGNYPYYVYGHKLSRFLHLDDKSILAINTDADFPAKRFKNVKLQYEYYKTMCADRGSIDGVIRQYEKFYDGRYRETGDYEGGSMDNPYIVDWQLAAILKKQNWAGDSIHFWRWG